MKYVIKYWLDGYGGQETFLDKKEAYERYDKLVHFLNYGEFKHPVSNAYVKMSEREE